MCVRHQVAAEDVLTSTDVPCLYTMRRISEKGGKIATRPPPLGEQQACITLKMPFLVVFILRKLWR